MKKILMVTYHFPPDAAVGAVRAAKFAKYLSEFGWEPIILTVKEKYYHAMDYSQAHDHCMQPTTIRTRILRNPSFYYRKLKRLLHLNTRQAEEKCPSKLQQKERREKKTGAIRLRTFINTLLACPDEQVGWLPFAVFRGYHIIRREGIAIVMTSGPPHSVHLIGACLSRLTRIPWIADFRDPLPFHNAIELRAFQSDLLERLERRLEALTVLQGSLVLTTTERLTKRLQVTYPQQTQKIWTLPNGYDADDFARITDEKEKRFTISYLGSLYHHRNCEPVLRALLELIKEKRIDPNRLVVRFVGHFSEVEGKEMKTLIAQYGLAGIAEIFPWLPRHHALEMMVRSHLLLLLAENQPLQIPYKIYDYLGAGSDILAITGEGATADVLHETGAGVVVSPGDHQGLKGAIRAFYTKFLSTYQNTSFGKIDPPEKYSRRRLTEELAKLLEKVYHACSEKQQ